MAEPRKRKPQSKSGPTSLQRIRSAVVLRMGVHLTPAETAELYWRAGLDVLAAADDERMRPAQLGLGADLEARPAPAFPGSSEVQ